MVTAMLMSEYCISSSELTYTNKHFDAIFKLNTKGLMYQDNQFYVIHFDLNQQKYSRQKHFTLSIILKIISLLSLTRKIYINASTIYPAVGKVRKPWVKVFAMCGAVRLSI